jgi:hypothetical protein
MTPLGCCLPGHLEKRTGSSYSLAVSEVARGMERLMLFQSRHAIE